MKILNNLVLILNIHIAYRENMAEGSRPTWPGKPILAIGHTIPTRPTFNMEMDECVLNFY